MVRVMAIDINCDMGESFGNYAFGNDPEVMPYITAANAACGFHAGDPTVMQQTVALAKAHGVEVGAHTGLPDLLGFGRRYMRITPEDARDYTLYQVGALKAFVEAAGLRLHHVKPHGAMYQVVKESEEIARAVFGAVRDIDPGLVVYFPAPLNENLIGAARATELRLVGELYVDLEYAATGELILERHKQAIDIERAAQKVVRFVKEGKVAAKTGVDLQFEAYSVCVHGDGPDAVPLLHRIHHLCQEHGIDIVPVRQILNGL